MTRARGIAIGLVVAAALVAAMAAPVWTYALSLALFGLPHVACELRYVDQRFGARLGRRTWALLAAVLLGIALLRAAALGGVGSAGERATGELLLGAVLAMIVLPRLRARGALAATLGTAVLALAVWSAVATPLPALVTFALLHNVTPVGLLAERLRGAQRRRALAWCAVLFVGVPLAIAGGWLGDAATSLGLAGTDGGPWHVGDFELHAPVFVPQPWLAAPFAYDLFRAAAFLQCMHYVAVIVVLPALGAGDGALPRLRWPTPRAFAVGVVAASAALLLGYLASFGSARAVYGVFASVHAWLEVPVLLLACAAAPMRSLQAAPAAVPA